MLILKCWIYGHIWGPEPVGGGPRWRCSYYQCVRCGQIVPEYPRHPGF